MSNVIQLKERNHSAREEVAASVRSFIARAGASKSQVAREIGMAQSTFSRRTTGAEPFDADELGAIADYFEVSLVELITGDINKIPANAKKAPKPKLESLNNSNLRTSDYKVEDSKLATVTHLAARRATKTA